VVGKTNMPEFGLGSHTFNTLFGATLNAWDASVSAGGSSGSAAVALAQRLLPVANGSDFMGSLRNPAAWNHVFGMRPSQGRVPFWPASDVWVSQLGTEGPMARSVADLTQLLAIQAGHDARVPLSIDSAFVPPLLDGSTSALKDLRIGWLGDLGGHLALEPGIAALCEQALQRCESEGAHVEALTKPGFDANAVWQAWLVWRRALVAPRIAPLLQRDAAAREHIKPEALWEHDQAQGTTVMDLMRASEARSTFLQQLLALPATQVWPFAVGERWPQQIAGRTMDTYHRWTEATLYATFAGRPATSVPAGFHANGRWPGGLQLIGRPRRDAALLRIAAAYECTIGNRWHDGRASLHEMPSRRCAAFLRFLVGQADLDPAERAVVGDDTISRQDLQRHHAGAARSPVARVQADAERRQLVGQPGQRGERVAEQRATFTLARVAHATVCAMHGRMYPVGREIHRAPPNRRRSAKSEETAAGIVGDQLGLAGPGKVGEARIGHLKGRMERRDGRPHLVGQVRRVARRQASAHAERELGLDHAHAVAGERQRRADRMHEAVEDAPRQRAIDLDVRLPGCAGGGDLPADHGAIGNRGQRGLDRVAGHSVVRTKRVGQGIDDRTRLTAGPEQAGGVVGVGVHRRCWRSGRDLSFSRGPRGLPQAR
jgi:amidase